MARIRTIKPEFWDSPSVAKASPWARLLFIAMWNWADDYGRGTANLKELEGFAFPNDDEFTDSSGNTVTFRSLVAEVSECFGVVLYEVEGRRYFEIPTWDTHQRNEKRAKQSKHPDPPVFKPNSREGAEIPTQGADAPRSSVPGTGEQGNRGTGEQGNREASEVDTSRPDVELLLDQLDSEIENNGSKKPKRNKTNHDAMRLLLDRDGYSVDQVAWMIRWCQRDEFWRSNILSASKLREKFDQMKLQAQRKPKESSTSKADEAQSFIERLKDIETGRSGEAAGDSRELR